MIYFKNDIELNNGYLSQKILSDFNSKIGDSNLYESLTNLIDKEIGISGEVVSQNKIELAENVFKDFQQENLVINNFVDYKKLYPIVDHLKHKLTVFKSKQNSYFETPVEAYDYKENNKTDFLISDKLTSLLYR